MTINEIKDAIGVLPRRKDGQVLAVPLELRQEIISLAKSDGNESVGEQLGISPVTIYSWTREQKPPRKSPLKKARFSRVEIVPEIQEQSFVVEGPNGLRFVGLTLSDAAKLLREVSHEF